MRDYRSGRLDRRSFLALCAVAGAAPLAVSMGDAEAAANEIVMWNWGGDAVKCHTDAFGGPFAGDTGMKFKVDTSGPLQGKVKEMVDSGNVTAERGRRRRLRRDSARQVRPPRSHRLLDRRQEPGAGRLRLGARVSIIFYGYAFMYDTGKFKDDPPSTWADFFDTAKYPGKRSLYKWANGAIEAALLADGVAGDAVYPIDLDRALAKIRSIKPDTYYWVVLGRGQQMIIDAEVSMGMVWAQPGQERGGGHRRGASGST